MDGKICDASVFELPEFRAVFEHSHIICLCKNVESIIQDISKVKSLKYLHIFQSGVIESLQNLIFIPHTDSGQIAPLGFYLNWTSSGRSFTRSIDIN